MTLHRPRSLVLRGVHLLVLCGFALAQPLFDILGSTPEFFVTRGSTSWDVILAAVGLVVLPAAALLAVEAVAGLVRPSLQDACHLIFVGGLVALIALQALRRLGDLPGWPLVAAAAAVGALAAVCYSRFPPARTALTVLAPAPFIFLVLFLVNAPLAALRLESGEAESMPAVESRAPVVMIVFDELPLTSLLDAEGRVDAQRFPSFGALADAATWFPRATTVHDHTTGAVPSILTGENPDEDALPVVADHPRNLFTYLARSYRMHVLQSVTQLCPSDICERRRPSFGERMQSLASDLRYVYLHVTLPEKLADGLPPIDETWQDFGDEDTDDAPEGSGTAALGDGAVADELWTDQRFQFERWVAEIEPAAGRPTLHFIHTLLPHRPWRYLPDGKQYGNASTEGLRRDVWEGDDWLVTQAYQRHLLQVGFADRLLGSALDRLHATGLFDRSLIVVVADHGASFRAGGRRRGIEQANAADIAPVPLFVKLPGQTGGELDERDARTTDILPTIAAALVTPLPSPVDGRSLLDPAPLERPAVVVGRTGGGVLSVPSATIAAEAVEAVAEKVRVFGTGAWDSVYTIGPHSELIGQPLGSLAVDSASELSVTIDAERLLQDVALDSALLPVHITGQISGELPLDLALALNGRIAAVTRAVKLGGGTRFAAMVPESALLEGQNAVEILAVHPSPSGVELERLVGGGSDGRLEASAAGETIQLENGQEIAVVPGALEGAVEDWVRQPTTVRFVGWAADVDDRALADRILVFADGRLAYSTASSFNRPDVAKAHGVPEGAGFVFELPLALADPAATTKLRFFAVRNEQASELSYPRRLH
jgi:Sulfatase